jgi:RNA polymerase sigma-70 factor (ECF subfamily)
LWWKWGTFDIIDSLIMVQLDLNVLVKRCKSGDQEAWHMIIDQYSKTIYNMALNFTGNSDDASDITQDIFLKIYNNIDKFSEEKNFHSWLLRLSKNHCIDFWRKHRRELTNLELDENISGEGKTPEDAVIQEYDISTLREKMTQLAPELRVLLIMRDIQDFSYADISRHLNIPLGTVKSRINRGRVKLAGILLNEDN